MLLRLFYVFFMCVSPTSWSMIACVRAANRLWVRFYSYDF